MKRGLLILFLIIIFISACAKEQSIEDKDELYRNDSMYFDKATEELDLELCNKISLKQTKDSCIATIGIKKNDLEDCNLIEGKSRDYCIAKIAINKTDFSLCNDIKTTYWADICNKDIALATKNPVSCAKIVNFEHKDECYGILAKDKLDGDLCDYISDERKHAGCLRTIATETLNEKWCEGIKGNSINIDSCLAKIAELKKDSAICENIRHSGVKSDCLKALS